MPDFSAILLWMLALPAVGGVLGLALPPSYVRRPWIGARAIGLIFGLTTFVLAARAADLMNRVGGQLGMRLGSVEFRVDGLAMALVLLVTGLAVIIMWASVEIPRQVRTYFVMLQFFLSALLTALSVHQRAALGVCIVIVLGLLVLLLTRWDRDKNALASFRHLALVLVGVLMVCIALWARVGVGMDSQWTAPVWLATALGIRVAWIVLALLGALLAVVALQGWLADAVSAAATPVAMLLTGLGITLIGYLMVRGVPGVIAGHASRQEAVALVGTMGIVYGAFSALRQRELPRVAAYISSTTVGFLLLGMAAGGSAGFLGAACLLVGHAVAVPMLLYVAGMIYERAGHCEMARLGGWARYLRLFSGWSGVAVLAAAGLPGLPLFAGEMVIVMCAFQASHAGLAEGSRLGFFWMATGSGLALMVLLAGGVWNYQRIFLGPPHAEFANVARMSIAERWILALLGALALVLGVMPGLLIEALGGNMGMAP